MQEYLGVWYFEYSEECRGWRRPHAVMFPKINYLGEFMNFGPMVLYLWQQEMTKQNLSLILDSDVSHTTGIRHCHRFAQLILIWITSLYLPGHHSDSEQPTSFSFMIAEVQLQSPSNLPHTLQWKHSLQKCNQSPPFPVSTPLSAPPFPLGKCPNSFFGFTRS